MAGRKQGGDGASQGPDADAAGREALLEVALELDLDDQVRRIAARAAGWSAAAGALCLARGPETADLAVVATTPPGDDPPEGAPGVTIEVARVREALGAEEESLGPAPSFLPQGVGLPEPPGGMAWTLGVRDPGGELVGAVVLSLASAPAEGARERVRRLLIDSRAAVANALVVRSIRELVIRDDTAECFNRRYFNEFLVEELARASRFQAPMSLIFFDMDNLKEVNVRHGHAMGSRVIWEVSSRVRSRIRRFDKLFRFGGDEFCIVLPETEWHGALEVAERVRESIAGRPLLVQETGGTGVRMTASLGIASYPLHARTREELVQLADWAMQRIKKGTKNSIAIAEIARPERP